MAMIATCTSQERRFERRIRDLRNFRAIERSAVRELERLADSGCTAAEYRAAELHWADAYTAVRNTAAELGQTWYDE